MKLIHYLFFILLGIILYKYINNIEGLTCFTPFHDVLGDNQIPYEQVNEGSYPVLLNDNLVLQKQRDPAPLDFPAQGSQESRVQTFNDDAELNVVCDPGDATFPPWQRSSGVETVLRCKNPSAKVIIHCHGFFKSSQEIYQDYPDYPGNPDDPGDPDYPVNPVDPDDPVDHVFGLGRREGEVIPTRIFKRMQVFTYLNSGNCFDLPLFSDYGQLYNNIFDGNSSVDDFNFINPNDRPDNLNHFNTVFSEMKVFDKLLFFGDDTILSLINLTSFQQVVNINGGITDYDDTGDNFIAKLSLHQTDWTELTVQSIRQQLHEHSIKTDNIDIEFIVDIFRSLNIGYWDYPYKTIGTGYSFIGPFMSMYCGVTFADDYEFYTDPYFTNLISDFSTLAYEHDSENRLGDDTYTATFTISKDHINGYRSLIKKALIASCVTINLELLTADFRSDTNRLNRLFPNQETTVDLPLFFINVLCTPMFVNPPLLNPDGTQNPHSLPGGQYTSLDMIDVIIDIIFQIKNRIGGYYQIFIDILKKMGMNDYEIGSYIESLQLLMIRKGIGYFGVDTAPLALRPRGFIFNILRDLWLPWGYNILNIDRLEIWEISAPVIFMLLQLFKQNVDYSTLDVHMLTCFQDGSDRDLSRRDATMNYSWDYTWTDEEIATSGNPLDRKIGPTCEKKSCEQTKNQINSRLVALGKGEDFAVDDASYDEKSRTGIHPTYETKTYRRDGQNNIIIDEKVDQSTKIRVNCKNHPTRSTVIECKYNQGPPATFDYDESIINQLDPSICHDLDVSVEVEASEAVEAVCSAKQAQCVPEQFAGGLRLAFKC